MEERAMGGLVVVSRAPGSGKTRLLSGAISWRRAHAAESRHHLRNKAADQMKAACAKLNPPTATELSDLWRELSGDPRRSHFDHPPSATPFRDSG